MDQIRAIGFDLFNTLITMETLALRDALLRLTTTLKENGLIVEHDRFTKAYREEVLKFLEKTRKDGKESHNRYWISAALNKLGHGISPDDPKISASVDTYFSAFIQYASLIPGTTEMLEVLRNRYRIGLLSNFTHPPAAMEIISHLGLTPYFEVVLISGDLGFRKPHPTVFQRFIQEMGVEKEEIAFVGDDPDADISGASEAGLQPIWTTYVRDHNIAPAPGVMGPTEDDPDPSVPRISVWQDLLTLLDSNQ